MNIPHEAQRHHEDFVASKKRFIADINYLEKAVISNLSCWRSSVMNNHDKAKFNDSVELSINVTRAITK